MAETMLQSERKVARMLHVKPRWVRRMIDMHDVEFTRVHRRRYVAADAVELLKSKRGKAE